MFPRSMNSNSWEGHQGWAACPCHERSFQRCECCDMYTYTYDLRMSLKASLTPGLHPDLLHIRWLQHGRYTKLLGVPFWASGEDNSFWDDLYIKIKSAIAAWRDLTRLT
eukprot:scaffold3639_cov141-Isochrysis_galbana.AAC.20